MKKLGYLLSIAGHALALLVILNARFPITIQPSPPKVVAVSLAEPPPRFAVARPNGQRLNGKTGTGTPGRGQGGGGGGSGKSAGAAPISSGLSFPAPQQLDLARAAGGDFRLAPVGKNPEPWAVPIGPGRPAGLQRFRPGDFRPGTAPGGGGGPDGVFLLPFDIHERAVADWSEAVLSRVERNWIIPASGRLGFSGRVQITLVIERQGGQRSLVVDDATVPEPLTLAALHAVQASLPLPPIPENVAGDDLAFTFVFAYNG